MVVAVLDEAAGLFDVDGHLGHANDVRAAGDAGGDGDPAGVASHDLADENAVVRLRGGVQAIDSLGGDHYGGVEAKADIGAAEVVVNGLGNADAVDAALAESKRDGLGVVAAKRDERIELVALDGLQALFKAARHLLYVGARRAQNRAALLQDAGGRLQVQRHGDVVDDAAPTFHKADKLIAVVLNSLAHRGANDSVQTGAVAAAG